MQQGRAEVPLPARPLIDVPPLDALGHPWRRRILAHLAGGPLPVSELHDRLPMSRASVTRHLRTLMDADLIEGCQLECGKVAVRLCPAGFRTASQAIGLLGGLKD